MDIQENLVAVKDIFVESIKAIKQEVLKTLTHQYENVFENKIRWVLTVPAIWPDDSKLFMRECAQEVNITDIRKVLLLEFFFFIHSQPALYEKILL